MKPEMIILVVLMVALVVLFAIQNARKNKYNAGLDELRKDLKAGDKVMTDSGLVGIVMDFYEEDSFRYVVLKSGRDDLVGYFTVPANAIYYVYGKDLPKTSQPDTNVSQPEDKSNKKDTKTKRKKKD